MGLGSNRSFEDAVRWGSDLTRCVQEAVKSPKQAVRYFMDALPFCRATLYGVRCPQGPYYITVKRYPVQPR